MGKKEDRRCIRCHRRKHIDEFDVREDRPYMRQNYCKTCRENIDKQLKHNSIYIVVQDTLPEDMGGYPTGAEFNKIEMKHMLTDGGISIGTVVKRAGKHYRIEGKLQLAMED